MPSPGRIARATGVDRRCRPAPSMQPFAEPARARRAALAVGRDQSRATAARRVSPDAPHGGTRRHSSRTLARPMPELIESPSTIEAAGTKPKLIEEFVGRVNTGEERLSVARMRSPAGWIEPGQRPEFDEWTLVLDGTLRVEH